MEEAKRLKDEGNQFFKEGKYAEALSLYTEALTLNPNGGTETATYHKNRAACYLKQEKYQEAVNDCTAALEITPTDPKALFRRCQAYESINKPELSYKDAMKLLQVDPKNTAIHPILRRLNPVVQEMIKKQTSTQTKVTQMFDLALNSDDEEKRKNAGNNLIVLAREPAGAEEIFKNDGVNKLIQLLDTSKEKDIKLGAIRSLACLAHDVEERAKAVLEQLTPKKLFAYIGVRDDDISTAMANVLQSIINTVTSLEILNKQREAHEDTRKKDPSNRALRPFPFLAEKITPEGHAIANSLLVPMIMMLINGKVSAAGRDNLLELLIKFVTRKDGVGWTTMFIAEGGLQNLLTVAGTVPELKILPTSTHTRMHVSLCLNKIYEDLLSDKERENYRNACEDYFKDQFEDTVSDTKIEAITALGALLQGPLEVGNSIISKEGVLDLVLAVANSGNSIDAKYAIEALVHSASKKDKCSGVIKQATPILKQLYQSPSDPIKVRALVGLCKLGSFGGGDTSAKSFAEGSTKTLAKACRKFLCNQAKDVDLRKWAAEGLAYLTLDAEVKEDLCEDTDAMKSLIDLAKEPEKGILYPVAQIFVNITNSYDVKEIDDEMLELAKFAQHHIPEEHEKDKEPYISARVSKLVKAGGVNALVAFSRTESAKESDNSKELLARIYHAIATDQENRGLLVQQGGAKTLIPFALSGTKTGKLRAAQALAKICITTNPEIAFPGQRTCEVVRPVIQLLDMERHALENFEALMALTNLCSVSDSVRRRVVKEKGFSQVEHYMFEEHEQLRRAAVECMNNLLMCDEVVNLFKGENDRVKLLLLYCGDSEDEGLVRAASGALAMISNEREIAHKIPVCTQQWFDILTGLAAHEKADIQHRGLFILQNMMETDKELATKLVESNMLEVLMAVSQLTEPDRQKAKQCADKCLEKAVEWNLIKAKKDAK